MRYGMLLIAGMVLAQTQAGQYDEIKAALGLADSQLAQLQQKPAAPVPRPAPGGNSAPTPIYPPAPMGGLPGRMMQPAQNEAALRVLDDSQRAKLAEIRKVLDRWDAAAFEVGIGLIADEEWPGGGCLCAFYSQVRAYRYSTELGITDAQAQQLDRITQSVKAKDRREPALAVFNDAQRARLRTFEAGIELAREAMELGLIPRMPKGECLCH
jgi:hypothetical protein